MRLGDAPTGPSRSSFSHSTRSAGPAKATFAPAGTIRRAVFALAVGTAARYSPAPVPRSRFPRHPPRGRCAVPGGGERPAACTGTHAPGAGKGGSRWTHAIHERRGGAARRGWLPAVSGRGLPRARAAAAARSGTPSRAAISRWTCCTSTPTRWWCCATARTPTTGRGPCAALREPLQNGGAQKDQDVVVNVLTTAAESDRQVVCRMAAISSLRHFKDPRADRRPEGRLLRGRQLQPRDGDDPALPVDRRPRGDRPAGRGGTAGEGAEGAAGGRGDGRQAAEDGRAHRGRAPWGTSRNTRPRRRWPTCCGRTRTWPCATGRPNRCRTITGKTLPADYQPWADFLNAPGNKDAIAHGQTENKGIDLISWWWK